MLELSKSLRKQRLEIAMKLAEALQERADLVVKINQIKARLANCVLVQEGEEPLENPQELKSALDNALERLEFLIERINLTNAATMIDGASLTQLIAHKDVLNLKIKHYSEIINEASEVNFRARGGEIKFKPTIDISAWQKQKDDLSKELRLVDNKLQQSNWTVDLIE